jgi:hypothetical protein
METTISSSVNPGAAEKGEVRGGRLEGEFVFICVASVYILTLLTFEIPGLIKILLFYNLLLGIIF